LDFSRLICAKESAQVCLGLHNFPRQAGLTSLPHSQTTFCLWRHKSNGEQKMMKICTVVVRAEVKLNFYLINLEIPQFFILL